MQKFSLLNDAAPPSPNTERISPIFYVTWRLGLEAATLSAIGRADSTGRKGDDGARPPAFGRSAAVQKTVPAAQKRAYRG